MEETFSMGNYSLEGESRNGNKGGMGVGEITGTLYVVCIGWIMRCI